MVNRVILIGNLGRDPEVRRLENGAVVAKFSIATNENYKDKSGEWQKQTEWHDIVLWRTLAERAERDLKKGLAIYLEGKLTHRTWQDQDGNNRKTTEVVASYFRIVSKKEGSSSMSQGSNYFPSADDEKNSFSTTTSSTTSTTTSATTATASSAPAEAVDDDLPF
ncbi:MAG: single-stranded DNA-binding protein [Bacteroidota bacterium]